MERFSASQI